MQLLRSDPAAWAIVFCVALVPRLLHLGQISSNDPFFHLPAVDGQVYHAWALRIADGDWLGQHVLVLGPLYPYLMGLLYTIAGPDFHLLKLVQAVLGALSAVLVFELARMTFDRRVAWVAGVGTAIYGLLIFYGGTVMLVNLQVPLVLAACIQVVRALRKPTAVAWLCVGLLCGLSVLARQTMLLFVPLILAWFYGSERETLPTRRRFALVLTCVVGVSVVVLPFTLRNYYVGQDFVLINSTGGANLYMGNNARANGSWLPPRIERMRADNPEAMRMAFTAHAERDLGRSLKPSEVSAYWTDRALDYIFENPGAWLQLELRKLGLFVNAQEIWNSRSIEVSREFSWVLRLPLLEFGIVAPLALLGIALSYRRWRTLVPLYLILAVYLAAGLVFFVLSRYRMPAAPILLIFASFGVVWLYDSVRAQSFRKVAIAVVALVPLWWITHLDLLRSNLYMAYYNLANKYRDLGRWEEAIETYEISLAINPHFISSHNNLALTYESADQPEKAIERWRRVLERARLQGDPMREDRALRHLRELGAESSAPDG